MWNYTYIKEKERADKLLQNKQQQLKQWFQKVKKTFTDWLVNMNGKRKPFHSQFCPDTQNHGSIASVFRTYVWCGWLSHVSNFTLKDCVDLIKYTHGMKRFSLNMNTFNRRKNNKHAVKNSLIWTSLALQSINVNSKEWQHSLEFIILSLIIFW